MNLQLIAATLERKDRFFVAAEEIENMNAQEKESFTSFLKKEYLQVEKKSVQMYVIKKDLQALYAV